MELTGESIVVADRDRVWAALNDPAVLAHCLDAVDARAAISTGGATRLEGATDARAEPIRAVFAGGVKLTEVDPPTRCVVVAAGRAGTAGAARGRAEVTLTDTVVDDRAATRLSYVAQIDAPPIAATARDDVDAFLARLKAEVESGTTARPTDAAGSPVAEPRVGDPAVPDAATDTLALHGNRRATGLTPLVWSAVVVMVVLIVLIWQLS